MDRTVWIAAIVFAALALVGLWFSASPTTFTSDPGAIDAFREIGAALLAGGLAAFLVETLHWDYHRRHA